MKTKYTEDIESLKQSLEKIRNIINDEMYYHTDNLKNRKSVVKTLKVLKAHTIKLANSLK